MATIVNTNTFNFRADAGKNRLYLEAKGFLGKDEVGQFLAKGKAEIAKLKQGFDIISDTSEMVPTSTEVAEAVQQFMVTLQGSGVGRSAIVLNNKNTVAKAQLERLAKEAGYTTVITASTVAEAEKILDS